LKLYGFATLDSAVSALIPLDSAFSPPLSARFRRLLAAVRSIPPSPRRRLLDLEGDGGSCRSRRGAAREGSRAAERRTEMAEQQREAAPRRDEWRRNEWWRTRESPGGD